MPEFSTGKLPLGQILRYGIVGVISNLTGYLVYLAVTYLGVEPKLAMTVLYAAGATVGFFGNRKWAFRHEGSFWRAASRYAIAHLCGYSLNFCLLYVFVDRLGYPHQLIQAIAIFVVAGFLFLVFKFFVFRTTKTNKIIREY
ncbi:GtrA family protein [Cupriavidus pauculus]|uniref:GtrA/DPMS transmembrane domain-containing protein n=1 Tax=Cupriavidus pauculus TaxID=82633 RepID=A0A2N5CH96_9BURK|nr:GtrA family protein [Cupriavidus pauculus]PLQ01535.1 hypothetical protein CYJ10_07625 [Cupriavidus pauculus]